MLRRGPIAPPPAGPFQSGPFTSTGGLAADVFEFSLNMPKPAATPPASTWARAGVAFRTAMAPLPPPLRVAGVAVGIGLAGLAVWEQGKKVYESNKDWLSQFWGSAKSTELADATAVIPEGCWEVDQGDCLQDGWNFVLFKKYLGVTRGAQSGTGIDGTPIYLYTSSGQRADGTIVSRTLPRTDAEMQGISKPNLYRACGTCVGTAPAPQYNIKNAFTFDLDGAPAPEAAPAPLVQGPSVVQSPAVSSAEDPSVGNATGSTTRSGNQRVVAAMPLKADGTVPKGADQTVLTQAPNVTDWLRGKPGVPQPNPQRAGQGLQQIQSDPQQTTDKTQTSDQKQRANLLVNPPAFFNPAPSPVPTQSQTTGPPPSGPGPSSNPRRQVIVTAPPSSAPTGLDGTGPGPAAPPAPDRTPEQARFYGDKGFGGGGGGGPRPDLPGIAEELGRIEQKLGTMLDPRTGSAPDLWDKLKDLWPLIQGLLDLLSILESGTQYSLQDVCPPEGAEPAPTVWSVGGVPLVNRGVAERLDAIADMLQVHKNLRQPICKKNPVGQPVQVQFTEIQE